MARFLDSFFQPGDPKPGPDLHISITLEDLDRVHEQELLDHVQRRMEALPSALMRDFSKLSSAGMNDPQYIRDEDENTITVSYRMSSYFRGDPTHHLHTVLRNIESRLQDLQRELNDECPGLSIRANFAPQQAKNSSPDR